MSIHSFANRSKYNYNAMISYQVAALTETINLECLFNKKKNTIQLRENSRNSRVTQFAALYRYFNFKHLILISVYIVSLLLF